MNFAIDKNHSIMYDRSPITYIFIPHVRRRCHYYLTFYWAGVKFGNVGIPNTLPLSPNRPAPSSASSSNTAGNGNGGEKRLEEEKRDADIGISRIVHNL